METARVGRGDDSGKHPKPPTICMTIVFVERRGVGGGWEETEDKKHVIWQHFTNTQESFLEHY